MKTDLLDEFRSTTRQRIEKITLGWISLESTPGDEQAAADLMRNLHSLKGEAKMMGFPEMSRLAHRIEELALVAQRSAFDIPDNISDLFLASVDLLAEMADGRDTREAAAATHAAIDQGLLALGAGSESHPGGQPALEAIGAEGHGAIRGAVHEERFVRIPTDIMAELADSVSEGLIEQGRYEQAALRMRRLANRAGRSLAALNDLLNQRLTRIANSDEPTETIDALAAQAEQTKTLLRQLELDLEAHAEILGDGGGRLRQLNRTARRLRLVPVRGLFEPFVRVVRDLAKESGKQAVLAIAPRDVNIDKAVAKRLEEPLLHMLRNSVDHGIETPAERTAAGKAPAGTIRLSAYQDSGTAVIQLEDDGRGIDLDAVRARAIERGVMTPQAAESAGQEELFACLFRTGFSTKEAATEVSGRGVGLDVVQQEVERLGGTVRLTSEPGRGILFELRVPISVALSRVLFLRTGKGRYAVPVSSVQSVLRVEADQIDTVHGRPAIRLDERNVALVDLSLLLGEPSSNAQAARVLVLSDGSRSLAVAVEEWPEEEEVVVKPPGQLLAGLRLLAGCSILREGQVALLLDVPELINRASRIAVAQTPAPQAHAKPDTMKRILLAEDSSIIRAMLTRTLQGLGYEVIEASDGAAALEQLERQPVDLVLSDIDMPRMNGVELIQRVRQSERWQNLPVVVLSTLSEGVERQAALDAGADLFLAKSEFSEATLGEALAMRFGLADHA